MTSFSTRTPKRREFKNWCIPNQSGYYGKAIVFNKDGETIGRFNILDKDFEKCLYNYANSVITEGGKLGNLIQKGGHRAKIQHGNEQTQTYAYINGTTSSSSYKSRLLQGSNALIPATIYDHVPLSGQ